MRTEGETTDSPGQYDPVMDRVEQVYAVVSTTKQILVDLLPELKNLVAIDHVRTVTAAVFMLNAVEYELDDINVHLCPTKEIRQAIREMTSSAKKEAAKKK